MLRLNNITKKFSQQGHWFYAVNNVSLHINEGESVGLVGASGSGKTTLGRIALRLTKEDTGQVLIGEQDITSINAKELKPFRRKIGAVFQDPYASFNPMQTIGESIEEPLFIGKNTTKEEGKQLAVSHLAQVGLDEGYYYRYPGELSGGQRQRAAIARSLILKPEILIADEPVSALDISIQTEILYLFQKMQRQLNLAMLFISHDLAVVSMLCQRVAIMYKGEIVEQGTTEQIFNDPQQEYTKKLITAAKRSAHS